MSLFPIERLPHLTILQAPDTPERYKRQVKKQPSKPQGGEREKVARSFQVAFERIEQEGKSQYLPAGIQPHLVFRLPLFENVNIADLEEKLDRAGLTVVSIEHDKSTVVAFRSDNDLSEFRAAIETYKSPNSGAESTVFDVLEWIKADEMRSWNVQDRIGPQLLQAIGDQGQNLEDVSIYPPLDVELWARGLDAQAAQKDLEEIRALLNSGTRLQGEDILDHYAGATICQARVRVSGARLRQLLHMDIVASVDFPSQPSLTIGEILSGSVSNFPPVEKPNEVGPRLCVLDSGIVSSHPLLAPFVGFEEAFLTAVSTVADQHGHGTRVAGIAVYGDVRRCIEEKKFQSPITLFSGRILNERNELDDEKLFITQIREALETFTKEPYECRIFNLSFGRREPWDKGKQTLWGEALDNLAREYKVLFVVSSGNNTSFETTLRSDDSAEKQLMLYHGCLLTDDWRLCDPATSALALTVGAITDHDIPISDDDIKRAVANKNQPSPFSRSGPGVLNAMKPDFVDNGGNLVFKGYGSMRQIGRDPLVSVISLHREPTERLFSVDIGTSLAAPRLSRIAALTEWQLWRDLGERPDPNLVRAVMATAASIPEEAKRLFGSDEVFRACGYGRVNSEDAIQSRLNRVLLCAQSEVELDHISIFRVPVPSQLFRAQGEKKITVALAFDPPVRARRNDYLGVEMNFTLVRGKQLDEVYDAYRTFTVEEKKEDKIHEPFDDKYIAKMTPTDSLKKVGIKRKRSTLQCAYHRWTRQSVGDDYGQSEEWYLVVRAENRWAKSEIEKQSFAVAVAIEANTDALYNLVRQRVQIQSRVQVRG
jgi:hypothetical protein